MALLNILLRVSDHRLRERRRCVIVLLCGTSGSGKSTLASILVSLNHTLLSWWWWDMNTNKASDGVLSCAHALCSGVVYQSHVGGNQSKCTGPLLPETVTMLTA